MTKDTPAVLGYRMPAEWEPHEATWIAWPHQRADWPGKFGPIPWVYTEIVRHLHRGEIVRILVNNPLAEKRVRDQLRRANVDLERVEFLIAPTNRVWTRDYGPNFIRTAEGTLAAIDWGFNAWAKYPDWQEDDKAGGQIPKQSGMRSWRPMVGRRRVILEGGSIDVNGAGLLLTTEECLLSPIQERNPGLSRQDYEQLFADYLGIRKVLWLNRGIAGDDTHGHVDDLARFVGPRTVVTVIEDNRDDDNYEPLRENLARLRSMTDVDGNSLEVVTLPMPTPLYFRKQRLPASYANFYIGNSIVLMPTFNDPADRRALTTLAKFFPDRTVVGIHAVDLVWGLGTLHCLTQQQPAGVTRRPARRSGKP
jgi:agmatine deiminase